jgi:YD repeat-containing protein
LTNSSQTLALEYDSLGQLTASTNPAGKTEYGRDQHGWITSRRLPSGYQIDFTRNAAGQIIRRKDNQGRDLSYSRDKSGALVKVTANDGSWVAAARDDQGRITSLINSSGQSRKFSYDSHSRMIAYTDATGSIFSVEYGSDGTPSRMVQKGGNRVITQGFVANVPSAAGSASEAYTDGWKDPAGSHTLLASFDDGFAEKLGLPRVSAGQKGVEQSIEGATPDCGLPQCPPGSNGPQSAQCLACQSHAHSVLVACLAAASAAEAAADVACSQKPANQQKACYATAAAVYAAAVTYCDVNYNSAMSTCTYGVCACPTTCTGAPGCP